MKRRQKITEFFFNEQDGIAEVYTHNTDLKKRLMQYAKAYPQLCQLTEADEDGGMRFEIDKHRISIRLTAPYSEERRSAAKKRGKESGFGRSEKKAVQLKKSQTFVWGKHRARIAAGRSKHGQKPEPTLI